jgi:hypothetical protein
VYYILHIIIIIIIVVNDLFFSFIMWSSLYFCEFAVADADLLPPGCLRRFSAPLYARRRHWNES